MALLKYPIGIQTFSDIVEGGYLYADKTGCVYQLVSSGLKHVFLSRPRRFGKSLLLSTVKAYFEGRKELFDGLELGRLETQWEYYPVLHFSFGALETQESSKINNSINLMLRQYEMKFGVAVNDEAESFGTRFGLLIQNVAEKTGKKVVVLIDEYDKGIVEMLHNKEQLDKNMDLFRPFYSQLKDQDEYLRFVFLTGVSRFRNLTLFSSPNQLQDISMDSRFAAICGLTPEELHTIFAEGIEELAKRLKLSIEETKNLLKVRYDGYRFTEEEIYLYNPFSILNCMSSLRLSNYWLTSGGSMKVFIDFLKKSSYNLEEIENMWVDESELGGAYSLTNPVPLLFQTGYLTIRDYKRQMYQLGIPNGEVRTALVDQLAPEFLGIDLNRTKMRVLDIADFAEAGDAEGLMREFQSILSMASHQHFRHNKVENVFALSIWLICHMAGIHAHSEYSVAGGDIDMLIESRDYVYVLEFKRDQSAEKALEQIDTKAYALPWQADGRKVFKIGVEFSSENRNISSRIIR